MRSAIVFSVCFLVCFGILASVFLAPPASAVSDSSVLSCEQENAILREEFVRSQQWREYYEWKIEHSGVS